MYLALSLYFASHWHEHFNRLFDAAEQKDDIHSKLGRACKLAHSPSMNETSTKDGQGARYPKLNVNERSDRT